MANNIKLNITNNDLEKLQFTEYFQTYQQIPEVEQYYTSGNSSIWQMFHNEVPNWVHKLIHKLPQDFTHAVTSVTKIMPGNTVPCHLDKHYLLQQQYGEGNTWRYLIMLEDWKSGHYFELENIPYVQWSAGDWIKIHRSKWHLAGNMGVVPFYSAQVTVI